MKRASYERPYSIHPSSIILILVLLGITALFGALSFAYMYTRIDRGMSGIKLPWIFIISSFILFASSVFIHLCRKAFTSRDEKRMIFYGALSLVTVVLFLILQGAGWNHLFTRQITPSSGTAFGYLFAISILHFLHVLAGIPFLVRILWPLYLAYKDGTSSLYFLDQHHARKLKHTSWYWHFIDGIWIYLVIFFLINGMI